jgi:hypothetical protein
VEGGDVSEESRRDQQEESAPKPPDAGRPVGEAGAPDEKPGERTAEATPPIGDEDQNKGETASPPPEEETGV